VRCSFCDADFGELAEDDHNATFRLFPCVEHGCTLGSHGTCFQQHALFYFTNKWQDHARCAVHVEERNQELKEHPCNPSVTIVKAKYLGVTDTSAALVVKPLQDGRRVALLDETTPKLTFEEVGGRAWEEVCVSHAACKSGALWPLQVSHNQDRS